MRFSRIASFQDLRKIEDFDFLVSFIVLQHNPPPVIAHTIQILLSKLRNKGVALFQVPTFAADYSFDPKAYLRGSSPDMEMNAIPQRDLFAVIAAQGCRILEVREDDATGPLFVSQRFLVQKAVTPNMAVRPKAPARAAATARSSSSSAS